LHTLQPRHSWLGWIHAVDYDARSVPPLIVRSQYLTRPSQETSLTGLVTASPFPLSSLLLAPTSSLTPIFPVVPWRKTASPSIVPTPPAENMFLRRSLLSISEILYSLCPVMCLKRSAPQVVACSARAHNEGKAVPWDDTGSLTQLAEGGSLKDGSNVIAKIAPAHTNASVCLQREAHMYVFTLVFLSLQTNVHLAFLACKRLLKL
jgi:hypothetical protein